MCEPSIFELAQQRCYEFEQTRVTWDTVPAIQPTLGRVFAIVHRSYLHGKPGGKLEVNPCVMQYE